MNTKRFSLLLMCAATGLLAFLLLDMYSARKAPLYKRLERQWAADVQALEASGKLPASWAQVKDIVIIGGTAETKTWLQRIQIPLKENPKGVHRMEVLVVAWEENGKRGAMIQYNIEDGKTRNTLLELGRTLILSSPASDKPWAPLLEVFSP
ncbi:MAG: hypothetical protein KF799_07415 [Bdellovibrionales bacterium]|nr:hypothetical protein [Bdellovibrionales bacterium]